MTERNAKTSIVFSPSLIQVGRISPQQVTCKFFVSSIHRTRDSIDLINRLQIWTNSSMYTKNFFINYRSIGQRTQGLTRLFPRQRGLKEMLQLIKKIVGLRHGDSLIDASQEEEIIGHKELISKEGDQALNGLLIPACIISQKQVTHEFRVMAFVDNVGQLLIIAQGAAADIDRAIELEQPRLYQYQFSHFNTQSNELFLRNLDSFEVSFNRMQLYPMQNILHVNGLECFIVFDLFQLSKLVDIFGKQVHI